MLKNTVSTLIALWLSAYALKAQTTFTISTVIGNGTGSDTGDGGPGVSATINAPGGLAFDAAGNLYISEQSGNRVRRVAPNGIITTVAGNGTAGSSGDGGPATAAELNTPTRVSIDSSGNLYIADYGNNRIRKVTNGIITTIAGNGTAGFSGDNPYFFTNW
jgi:trimeric autotransporter adhesin